MNKSESLPGVDFFYKWNEGKQKEKVNNMVLFDKPTYDKLLSEVPKFKLITPSILSDCLRVRKSTLFVAAVRSCMMKRLCFMVWIGCHQRYYLRIVVLFRFLLLHLECSARYLRIHKVFY
ncbi:hypothetical protein DCAR_0831405 [Daucus carota subsp. sativus]|uniref:40S ribosomal protein S25 n=1 Tax=Daucus carota subsp. sativus TaxID=79200 RepID=A0AAF0XRP7_DAUCS|nr:hypothetical protein DCAR_0831405 [Daucus carota subsp. sativus]